MIVSSHGIIGSQITQFVGLLDAYPNAAAAYSLRKLRTAYTGSAIGVRRTDLEEMNIGFTSTGELDTSALTTFANGGNVFVKTWYDQSGNARNATQATAASQPQIVSSGSVILEGSKPTLLYDGVNDFMDATTVTTGNPKSIFIPLKFTTIGAGERVVFDSVVTNQALFYSNSGNISIGFGSFTGTGYLANTDFSLYSIMHNGASSNAFVDSTTQILTNANLGTNAFNGLRIAAVRNTASLFVDAKISEFIVYGSDQASNRTGIQDNINDFYSIY